MSMRNSNTDVAQIVATKTQYLVPMIAVYSISYIGLTILAGFAKGVLGIKVVGAFNVGFLLIAANYLLSWIIALVYVRVANEVFDPMSAQVRMKGAAR